MEYKKYLCLLIGIFFLVNVSFISAALTCTSGDLTSTCYLNTTYNASYNEIINANNLVIGNNGSIANRSTFSSIIINLSGNLTLQGNGNITASNITIFSMYLDIEPNASIQTNNLGYNSTQGPGAGTAAPACWVGAGGGGYGGTGGDAAGNQIAKGDGINGGNPYGSYLTPKDFGSGGGYGCGSTDRPGGSAGGIIKINISRDINVNGTISSNGMNGLSNGNDRISGGGSGGSIWIIANNISGNGNISANGGNGNTGSGASGAGSGGRIAIYSDYNLMTGIIMAFGGNSTSLLSDHGAAGTIYLKNSSSIYGDLIIKNNNRDSYETTRLLSGVHNFDSITLMNSGHLEVEDQSVLLNLTNTSIIGDGKYFSRITNNGNITINSNFNISGWTLAQNNASNLLGLINLSIGNNGILTHTAYSERLILYRLDINLNNLNVFNGASITTDIAGYYSTLGNGAGSPVPACWLGGGGGGYGGTGGDSSGNQIAKGDGTNGGASYGSYLTPIDSGSGGGYGCGSNAVQGGNGGGIIKLNISGTLANYGNISSNGMNGLTNGNDRVSGGGSGGSIWIIANNISGNGNISANGGSGNSGAGYSGAGSGGRIAIYSATNLLSGLITAYGGAATSTLADNGAAGTIYLKNSSSIFGDLIIKNNNRDSYETTRLLSGVHNFDSITLMNSGHLEIEDQSVSLNLTNTSIIGDGRYFSRITNNGNITINSNFNISGWTLAQNNASNLLGLINLSISNNGILTHTAYNERLILYRLDINLKNLNIYNTASVTTDSSGYYSTLGNGAGSPAPACWVGGAGGGYGGTGGDAAGSTQIVKGNGLNGGASYGNYLSPIDSGSGGGYGCSANAVRGGTGGGIIKINVSETLANYGNITSNGENGLTNGNDRISGGGSGGSIWIIANNISGNGNITANGGSGNSGAGYSGAGSGGRIAIYSGTNLLSGLIISYGGAAGSAMADNGPAGTIYLKNSSSIFGDLIIKNNNRDSYETTRLLSGVHNFDSITLMNSGHIGIEDYSESLNLTNTSIIGDGRYFSRITNNGNITIPANFNISGWTFAYNNGSNLFGLSNLIIGNGGTLTHTAYSERIITYDLDVQLKSLNMDIGSSINVDTAGFYSGLGSGAGVAGASGVGAGGGGYGGTGGDGNPNYATPALGRSGGNSYGNLYSPTDLGSGGGSATGSNCYGSSGGGSIKINASQEIIINGNITANGGKNNCVANDYAAGGGSGGSIWIIASNISGRGNISANGGDGTLYSAAKSGAGSGGRIAIYSNISSLTGFTMAYGGSTTAYANNGSAGTIYLKNSTNIFGDLIIKNNEIGSPETTRLLSGIHTFDSITLLNNGHLGIEDYSESLNLTNTSIIGDGRYFSRITNNGNITIPANFNISGWTFAYNNGSNLFGLSNLIIGNGGTLTHTAYSERLVQYKIDMSLTNFTLELGGKTYLDSSGFSFGFGPGAGVVGTSGAGAGGGGYGNSGGNGNSGKAGGIIYGSYVTPMGLGSSGGNSGSICYGGNGGGSVKVNASQNIIINGNFTANGGKSMCIANDHAAGGGSGGSIWIIASNISGRGNISANGGDGTLYSAAKSGAGSGGRIAIHSINSNYGGPINSFGGRATSTATNGGEGTIFRAIKNNIPINYTNPTIINGGGTNLGIILIKALISYGEDQVLGRVDFSFNGTRNIVYDNYPRLWLGFNNISTLDEIDGRLIDSSVNENHAGLRRFYHTIDKFTIYDWTNEWGEINITGDKIIGKPYYILNFTSLRGNSITKNVSNFTGKFNHIEMRYRNYQDGPSILKLYYTNGVNCSNIGNETCSQDNLALNTSAGWHTLDAEINDAEWIGNAGNITGLRLLFNNPITQGEFYLDYISFYMNTSIDTAPLVVNGKYGLGYQFDGINDSIEIEDDDSLDSLTGDFSLAAWVKLNDTRNNTIVSKGNSTDYYSMYINNGYLTFDFKVANNLITPPLNTIKINDNNWHQVITTFRRAGSAIRYIDGVASGSSYGISANIATQNNSNNFSIGRSFVSGDYFNGTIDELQLFNREIIPAEIANLYYSNLYKINQTSWIYERNASSLVYNPGLYNFSVYSMDEGLSSNENVRTFYYDLTNPNGSLITPINQTYTNLFNTTNLTANLSDDASGLQNASLFVNGVLNGTIQFVQGTVQATVGIVVNLVDGIYNWFYQLFDAAGNMFTTNSRDIIIDTTYPAINFIDPTPANGEGKAGAFFINATINDKNLQNVTLWFNGSATTCSISSCPIANSTLIMVDSENWTFSVLKNNLSSATEYDYYISATDKASNINNSETRTVIGNRPPTFLAITRYPIDNSSIKPGEEVSFVVNVSDIDSNIDSLLLQWKNSTANWSEANNITMYNLTQIPNTADRSILNGLYNGSFILPSYEDSIYYRIYANDTLNDVNASTPAIVSAYWRCMWNVSYGGLSGADAYGYYTNNKLIGNITLINKGDILYPINNCTIVFSLSYSGFSPDYTSLIANSNNWNNDGDSVPLQFGLGRTISVAAGTNTTFNVYASFPSARLAESPFVKIVSSINDSMYLKNNESISIDLTISPPGAYLRQGFWNNPQTVYLTDTVDSSLFAYIENVAGNGSEINNAYNVSLNWTIPSGLSYLGEKNTFYDVMSNNSRLYQNINLTFDAASLPNAHTGVYQFFISTIGHNSSGNLLIDAKNNSILNSSMNVTLACYPYNDGICVNACINLTSNLIYDPDCEIPSGTTTVVVPGSGGGGGGGSSGPSNRVEKSEASFELVRGSQNEFQFEVKNKYDYELRGVNITVSGINAEYIKISPSSFASLKAKESKNITVKISAPAYFTGKKYTLIFDISGKMIDNSTQKQIDYTDRKAVTLSIVEIPRVQAVELVTNATRYLEEMNKSGMILKDAKALFSSLNGSYNEVEFGKVKQAYLQLQLLHDNAFEAKALIEEMTTNLNDAKTNGIKATEAKKLLLLGQTIYERGDYALALERLKEAKLTYALEVKGEFNLAYAIKNHPLESLGILIGLGLVSLGSGLAIRFQLLRRKLRMLNEEEVLLLELMKVIQKECFEKNHMSMEEYEGAMYQYENRLSQTVQEKISVETKIANLLKIKGKRVALGEEKARLTNMLKKVQNDYLNKGTIETRIYENMVKSYTARLSEVEEQIATIDADEAVKHSKFREQRKGL